MSSGWTNIGLKQLLGFPFRGSTAPTNLYLAAVTDAVTPDADTVNLSELTEIANGNGYTAGGVSLTPGGTDFPTWDINSSDDYAYVTLKDIVLTASGGAIPVSGDPIRWFVLVDDTPSDPYVYAFFDPLETKTISSGSTLTLDDVTLKITAV
jgi:hypothetical protein